MEAKEDMYGAFVETFELIQPTLPLHQPFLPLRGLTFAVKDIFDISGHVTGFGNPDWARTHAAATSTSPVVLALLAAGANFAGKTVMDEMAYSINGENKHYGTPTNPCVPDCVPGGSSSGSAVAVAGELVHFSLGTDTGGSVRVPAAYCGIFGFRPSHGVISTENVIPMAQSFDTVGWFARDMTTLIRVGRVVLPSAVGSPTQPHQILIPSDCFIILGSQTDGSCEIILQSAKSLGYSVIEIESLGDFLNQKVPSIGNFISKFCSSEAATIPSLAVLSHAMRLLQRIEFKANHGDWINASKPDFGPGIKERISEALAVTNDGMESCQAIKIEFQAAMDALLGEYDILAIPTVPGPPPKLSMEAVTLENFRAKAFSLLSVAGMSGFCQINIPLGMCNQVPVSISLLARHGADHFLLNVANEMCATLKQEASMIWKRANTI